MFYTSASATICVGSDIIKTLIDEQTFEHPSTFEFDNLCMQYTNNFFRFSRKLHWITSGDKKVVLGN